MNAHILLALAHLLLFMPALFFIGFSRSSLTVTTYNICIIGGVLMGLYHLMRIFKKISIGAASSVWINAIHAFALAPLLVYIGINKRDTPRAAYEMLLILAFGGFGYHLYNLILETQVHTD
jgi:hypothetical protein